MRLDRRPTLGIAAVLCVCVVVLPAVASSETSPTIEAHNGVGPYAEQTHSWLPASTTILPGAAVKFANPYAETNHGLEFTSAAKPTCTGIPAAAGEVTGAPDWHGECTFSAPGTYTFICTVHPSTMKGTIIVSQAGTTTTTTTTGSTTETSTSGSGTGAPAGAPALGSPAGAPGSPLAGSASSALDLAAVQHGHAVKGSVAVSQAGAGGTLIVQLLARRASLARAGQRQKVQVGRTARSSLRAGKAAFTVTLNAKARRALRARGRLALTVKLLLASAHGASVTLTRAVVLRS